MACNAYSVWNKRWALAYQWETLVQSRQFRVQSTDHYYAVHSNTKLYRDEGPGVFNHCPRCAVGHIHDCLFFHSSLASLFLDVIQSLDKTKSDDELDNLEVQSRIYTQLPGYFTKLGYPCEKATIWSCVQDKIDQTFPVGSLVMVNIPYYLKCREEEMEQVGFDGVALAEKAEIKKSSFTDNAREKSCGCDQWNGQGCIFFCFLEEGKIGSGSKAYAMLNSGQWSVSRYVKFCENQFRRDWGLAPLCARLRLNRYFTSLYPIYAKVDELTAQVKQLRPISKITQKRQL